MTSKEAMSIFYLMQEAESIKNEIAFYTAYSIELTATDVLKGIDYDGMPHSLNRSTSAPFEADVIKSVDKNDERVKRLTEALAHTVDEVTRLLEEFEAFMKEIADAKSRSVIRLRCINGFSWYQIGECLKMDRRTASRKFYQSFGEYEEKN